MFIKDVQFLENILIPPSTSLDSLKRRNKITANPVSITCENNLLRVDYYRQVVLAAWILTQQLRRVRYQSKYDMCNKYQWGGWKVQLPARNVLRCFGPQHTIRPRLDLAGLAAEARSSPGSAARAAHTQASLRGAAGCGPKALRGPPQPCSSALLAPGSIS